MFQNVVDRPGASFASVTGPAASQVAANWDLLAGAPGVLTHYDFWSGNVLWEGGILTGVVDWSGGALGPGGFDVGCPVPPRGEPNRMRLPLGSTCEPSRSL
jgi:hypothetical protein